MVNAGDFADQLEKAVERSRMIEAKPIEANVTSDTVSSASDTTATNSVKPMMTPDRRYRKW